MGLYHMDEIFHPGSIAVVGASKKEESIGLAVMNNLIDDGFDGCPGEYNAAGRGYAFGRSAHIVSPL